MSRVARVEAIPFRLPVRGELRWGKHGQLAAAEHVLVRVHLDDGTRGHAEAPPRPSIYGETVESVVAIVRHLEPRLMGLLVDDEPAIGGVLASVRNNNTALGALDMALWDARVRSRGQNLIQALAGPARRVRVSYILGISGPEESLEEARRAYGDGVRVFKVKVGRDHARDLRVARALRDEFAGAAVDIYADSNETLSPAGAADALAAMRDEGILWVEEPLPVQLLRERSALRAAGILPLIADDSAFTRADLERELAFDTFDVLNVKPARTGFSASRDMVRLARAAGKGVMVGSQAGTTLGTFHAALVASWDGVDYPSELSFFTRLEDEIVNLRPRIEEGFLS
ncbi:MAG TPA: enolase C-terminal domain-like protein, partial [Deinococcales bacterium]|nr:enolase C-terminal domain-like protein [Deinococcales bacterium]